MSDNRPTREALPYLDRFKRPYYRIDPTTGCWIWLRGFAHAYGVIWSPEKQTTRTKKENAYELA